jgi:uncharacterized membrane protein
MLGIVILAVVAFALVPARSSQLAQAPQSFERVRAIYAQRCQPCHSSQPTQPGFATAPNGVLLDTPEHILAMLPQTRQQLVTRAMPLGNLTGMTEPERTQLLGWIDDGAPR